MDVDKLSSEAPLLYVTNCKLSSLLETLGPPPPELEPDVGTYSGDNTFTPG